MDYGLADVHLQPDGRTFVNTYVRDSEGGWVLHGLPFVPNDATDAEALGQAVIDALHVSIATVVPAQNYRANPPDQAFLAWVGAPSYAEYMKGVRAVLVHGFLDGTPHILVTPQSNGGARSGFEPMREHRVKLDWSAKEAGAAVQAALEIATA